MLHYGRGSNELPTSRRAVQHVLAGLQGTLCLSTGVTMLIWLLHSGDDGSNFLPKSHKDATVEEEAIKLMLIFLETRLKSINFLLLLFFL